VALDGLVGAPSITIYAGTEAHSSVYKALGVVGLGRMKSGKHITHLAADPTGTSSFTLSNQCVPATAAP
jgi:hypothetical protein